MYINRIFTYIFTLLILSACTGPESKTSVDFDWFDGYDNMTTGTPAQMYGTFDTSTSDATESVPHEMAVLLPLSGQNEIVGKTIRTSIETAVLENAPSGLNVSFYDTNNSLSDSLDTALSKNPSIIIGPVFSDNAKRVRDARPQSIPVLSFTSDATALGEGVMTMNLMPTNSIETIIREMQSDGINKFIIMAPDTTSGKLMAGTAKKASDIYNLPLSGIFYYTESNPESIKNAVSAASMHNTRTAAHTRARQVLSDILINERLTAIEKSNLNTQLDKLSRTETIGKIPYDAVLFLGNGDDTKSLASYFRYYDVSGRDARFYGTTMWDGSDIASDLTMSGAKFATLPEPDSKFTELYERVSGTKPNRLATMGYDATNMAIGMIYSNKSNSSYLLDPSGYIGTDGLFRLSPTGASERSLRIVELDGSGTPRISRDAPTTFKTPLYNIEQRHISPAAAMGLQTPGIDPDNYITIPERFQGKYRSKTIGTNITVAPTVQKSEIIAILPEDDSDTIKAEHYTPIKLESVKRSYIEEYEIIEE